MNIGRIVREVEALPETAPEPREGHAPEPEPSPARVPEPVPTGTPPADG